MLSKPHILSLFSNLFRIRALVLLNLLNSLRKRNKMLGKPCILSLFPYSYDNFNKAVGNEDEF